MCRNHRGFVDALVAANRIGADILLLNTSFAGPALADVVDAREVSTPSSTTRSSPRRWIARWPTNPTPPASWRGPTNQHELTVEKLIAAHAGQQPERTGRKKAR